MEGHEQHMLFEHIVIWRRIFIAKTQYYREDWMAVKWQRFFFNSIFWNQLHTKQIDDL